MQIIADLHIHSKYARACSKRLDVENNRKACILKGIDLLGTGDFTHPGWLDEMEQFLEPDGYGFYVPSAKYQKQWLADIQHIINPDVYEKISKGGGPRFVLQTEINNIFARGEKKSRIHNCIITNSFKSAREILDHLSNFGSVESDGRLGVKQDQIETLLRLKQNHPESIFFAAHIWTPYFGVLGSRFGFKSLQKAYADSLPLMDAIETGLSSDPVMNWINPEIDDFAIISSSDAHSPENFAREANIFQTDSDEFITYKDLEKSIKYRKYDKGNIHNIEKKYLQDLFANISCEDDLHMQLVGTMEFYPQEGKYFGDGHKKCNFLTTPADTVSRNGMCPICGGRITVGVLHRSYDLGDDDRIADIQFGAKDFWSEKEINNIANKFNRPWFRYIVPLSDIIREVWAANKGTKKAEKIYNELLKKFGTEFDILLNIKIGQAGNYSEKFAWALDKVRNADIHIRSGFDGVFGVVSIQEVDDEVLTGDQDDDRFKQNTLF